MVMRSFFYILVFFFFNLVCTSGYLHHCVRFFPIISKIKNSLVEFYFLKLNISILSSNLITNFVILNFKLVRRCVVECYYTVCRSLKPNKYFNLIDKTSRPIFKYFHFTTNRASLILFKFQRRGVFFCSKSQNSELKPQSAVKTDLDSDNQLLLNGIEEYNRSVLRYDYFSKFLNLSLMRLLDYNLSIFDNQDQLNCLPGFDIFLSILIFSVKKNTNVVAGSVAETLHNISYSMGFSDVRAIYFGKWVSRQPAVKQAELFFFCLLLGAIFIYPDWHQLFFFTFNTELAWDNLSSITYELQATQKGACSVKGSTGLSYRTPRIAVDWNLCSASFKVQKRFMAFQQTPFFNSEMPDEANALEYFVVSDSLYNNVQASEDDGVEFFDSQFSNEDWEFLDWPNSVAPMYPFFEHFQGFLLFRHEGSFFEDLGYTRFSNQTLERVRCRLVADEGTCCSDVPTKVFNLLPELRENYDLVWLRWVSKDTSNRAFINQKAPKVDLVPYLKQYDAIDQRERKVNDSLFRSRSLEDFLTYRAYIQQHPLNDQEAASLKIEERRFSPLKKTPEMNRCLTKIEKYKNRRDLLFNDRETNSDKLLHANTRLSHFLACKRAVIKHERARRVDWPELLEGRRAPFELPFHQYRGLLLPDYKYAPFVPGEGLDRKLLWKARVLSTELAERVKENYWHSVPPHRKSGAFNVFMQTKTQKGEEVELNKYLKGIAVDINLAEVTAAEHNRLIRNYKFRNKLFLDRYYIKKKTFYANPKR